MFTVCVAACVAAGSVAGCSSDNVAKDTEAIAAQQDPPDQSAETSVPVSVGLIRIGPSAYDLTFTCFETAASGDSSEDILAVGVGRDVNNKRVQAFVQASVSEPYIGVSVGEAGEAGEAVRFEPRLGAPLEFTFDHNVVRFAEVDFVTDLDIETGQFTPAGTGSVVIECRSYATGTPAEFFQ